MTKTVLLVGGPSDGELLTVPADRHDLVVMEAPEAVYAWGEVDPVATIMPKKTLYRSKVLSFFRTPLEVFVHESLEGRHDATVALLAEHLLSDLGKACVR